MRSVLRDLVLTRDPKQRIRLAHSGLASVLMVIAILMMHAMAALGLSSGRWLWPWTVASAVGLVGLFLCIRLGWTARLRDPSLTVPQLLYAVACTAAAYRVAGAGHATALLMVAIVLMFGMFGLRRRQAWLLGVYTVVAFGLAMHAGMADDPRVFVPREQAAYLVSLGLFVCGLMAVSGSVAAMRQRLRAQRSELAAALERISLLATRDELTGLPNRRAMGELLEVERQRSARADHPWSVAILDVDHFKRVNDLHGHAAGDEALRVVARACATAMRAGDAASRWGGEEFVLLFRDAGLDAAFAVAERIRARVATAPVCCGEATFAVTVSMGVAAHRPGEDASQTLARADRALYAAKVAGRDRVRASVPDDPEAPAPATAPATVG